MRIETGAVASAGGEPQTFAALLAAAVFRGPQDPFLLWGEGPWISFAEFASAAQRFAGGLMALQVGKGERVAVLMENRPELLVATYGTLLAGAVFVPINPQWTPAEASYVTSHAGARVLVTEPCLLSLVRQIPVHPELAWVVVAPADGETEAGGEGAEVTAPGIAGITGIVPWAELLAAAWTPGAVEVAGDDLAAIQYTSGTTAFPKGVMHLNRTLLCAGRARARHMEYGPGDTMLVVSPLFHLNAQLVGIMALAAHFRLVLRRKFSAGSFWRDVHRHRITSFNGMQTIPRILLARDVEPGERGSPLRTVVGVLDRDLHRRFEERFEVALVPVYGLTEDPMPVLAPPGGFPPEWNDKIESAGRPVAPLPPEVHEIRILDEEGRDLPARQVGEIVKRSPATMAGYFRDPAATAAVLRDGWLATGDLGYLDEDGFLYFVSRKKDVIRRSGEMIAAAEVEAAIGSHPGVAEVAVLGVPDPIRSEELKAFVVLAAGRSPADLPPGEILEHCAKRLAPFKVPRYLEYRSELPRTATLKLQKESLRRSGGEEGLPVFDRERRGS